MRAIAAILIILLIFDIAGTAVIVSTVTPQTHNYAVEVCNDATAYSTFVGEGDGMPWGAAELTAYKAYSRCVFGVLESHGTPWTNTGVLILSNGSEVGAGVVCADNPFRIAPTRCIQSPNTYVLPYDGVVWQNLIVNNSSIISTERVACGYAISEGGVEAGIPNPEGSGWLAYWLNTDCYGQARTSFGWTPVAELGQFGA
jgi:hypothetical protein